jgi:hypothetical protein
MCSVHLQLKGCDNHCHPRSVLQQHTCRQRSGRLRRACHPSGACNCLVGGHLAYALGIAEKNTASIVHPIPSKACVRRKNQHDPIIRRIPTIVSRLFRSIKPTGNSINTTAALSTTIDLARHCRKDQSYGRGCRTGPRLQTRTLPLCVTFLVCW